MGQRTRPTSLMPKLAFALESRFPKLPSDGYEVTSRKDKNYNCIAWAAARDQVRWWEPRDEPGCYWPEGIATDYSIESFFAVFQNLGYSAHRHGQLDDGF